MYSPSEGSLGPIPGTRKVQVSTDPIPVTGGTVTLPLGSGILKDWEFGKMGVDATILVTATVFCSGPGGFCSCSKTAVLR